MGLLHDIQESVVQENSDLGSVLLKLRLLASRLGGEMLEEWVKYETEGYPSDIEVPSYRVVSVRYHGTFLGPFGSGINNAPIPTHLIEEFAGESWVNIKVRQSIAAIENLVGDGKNSEGTIGIDASNLILLLQGKVYENYACNDVRGSISSSALQEIKQAVRSRILELTLELEKNIPETSKVAFGAPDKTERRSQEQMQQISQQIIYGNVNTALAGGLGSSFNLSIGVRDETAFIEYLTKAGIADEDAKSIEKILSSEEPTSLDEPFGEKAKKWIADNLKKAADGTWKIGVTVATKVLSEAALQYYGLK